ncbi:DNA polymerase III subunit delta' [Amphiplicatus metriothermophilus]|uniref:DNA polymerase-3 subunit delta n=1 Tax=Amphiplicatus metriothermophilus TaxID=1519374 RepID=A0A239PPL9_9PROT|nr:DNA polymerase III subunit delta' [Amphiplicatus metriothermophilus]MBB5518627.1 DNA polymerase-3 subunit delta' [Amphiplicatus metriothermophilus]SNT72215.1 DNA polymerase-3 subunit delta' [Amphiplicatus metriothermophilus]
MAERTPDSAPALTPPWMRERIVGRDALEARLRAAIDQGDLSHGWLLAGPKGAGKATLAYRIARALLDPDALAAADSLQVPADSKVFRLVAGKAHPDLFVAERLFDEKTGRHQTEITVETIRNLTAFLNRTASQGGWRVAVIDAADEMNPNAANALLKALEEPPAKTALLLVSHAPGGLLATIRSRCRRIDLRPVADETVAALVENELSFSAAEARRVAAAARGRPGYALTLAAGEGAEAVAAAEGFIAAAVEGGDLSAVAGGLTGKAGGERWPLFVALLLEALREAASRAATGAPPAGLLARAAPPRLLEAHDRIGALARRGEAVNLDRVQLALAMGRILRDALQSRAV